MAKFQPGDIALIAPAEGVKLTVMVHVPQNTEVEIVDGPFPVYYYPNPEEKGKRLPDGMGYGIRVAGYAKAFKIPARLLKHKPDDSNKVVPWESVVWQPKAVTV